jgi:hypothetical protein
MIEEKNGGTFHLAGIVPIAGQPLEFNFQWHDSLMPIAPNWTMVEQAVYECAMAGCETIWIVCHDDMQPLVQNRIGFQYQDPVYFRRRLDRFPHANRRPISIYYVPIHPNDRDKRDCLGWSVIYGALVAFQISSKLSRWVTPSKYYVSFPYGVNPVDFLRPIRQQISSHKNTLFTYKGKSVRDGAYISFTFGPKDWLEFRRVVRKEGTGRYSSYIAEGDYFPKQSLPVEERYSARFFTLDKIFSVIKLDSVKEIELPWYYPAESWSGYTKFLGSEHNKEVLRPEEGLVRYKNYSLIGEEYGEE